MAQNIGQENKKKMSKSTIHNCRVCGFYMMDPPWGDNGQFPTYEICPCCGVEFGYEDCTAESTKDYRKKWLNQNVKWFENKLKPDDWDLEKQMEGIPEKHKRAST